MGAQTTKTSVLDSPGTFTKHANLRLLLAALAGAPLAGAASGMYSAPEHPLKATVGGAAGGVAGGAMGAGGAAAAMALLQVIAKKQIDLKLLSQAATIGALLGAAKGGQEATQSALGVTGAPQEALLAAILQEMQSANQPAPYRPDLLR